MSSSNDVCPRTIQTGTCPPSGNSVVNNFVLCCSDPNDIRNPQGGNTNAQGTADPKIVCKSSTGLCDPVQSAAIAAAANGQKAVGKTTATKKAVCTPPPAQKVPPLSAPPDAQPQFNSTLPQIPARDGSITSDDLVATTPHLAMLTLLALLISLFLSRRH
ncbi:hypothetical protein DFS34DRAFT_597471 [Phlyctochytrium arcticum]|nr:hypothetical protein DFS34DRAFT_597471 [Phlyctochytrium arcticum]